MYRHLVMFPRSADAAEVEDLVARTAAEARQAPGCRSITTSVDALMGPGAASGRYGRVLELDFDTLDEALALVQAESFQDVRSTTESLGATILLFERREL